MNEKPTILNHFKSFIAALLVVAQYFWSCVNVQDNLQLQTSEKLSTPSRSNFPKLERILILEQNI